MNRGKGVQETYCRIKAGHSCIKHKDDKGLVVPMTNTIIYPHTVMILHEVLMLDKSTKLTCSCPTTEGSVPSSYSKKNETTPTILKIHLLQDRQ